VIIVLTIYGWLYLQATDNLKHSFHINVTSKKKRKQMNTLVSVDIKGKERKKNGANGKGENGRWANVKGQDKGTGEWNGVNGRG
jgi:IS30 family transposase